MTPSADNRCATGGYVLAPADKPHRVTLIATGSEVAIAMDARKRLEESGIGTSVVSMPCLDLFEAQSPALQNSVIPAGTLRIAIEAGASQGWHRWIGQDGVFIGMSGFGASAPYQELYERFGITAEAIVQAAHARLKQ
jgi:transketolase